jgi:hypothetical protein
MLASANTLWRANLLHAAIGSESDIAGLLESLVVSELPGRRGLDAWSALLRAHATLLRQMETDLEEETGLALADFDVLAQLAVAGGELRMTELADRALISPPSSMIRSSKSSSAPSSKSLPTATSASGRRPPRRMTFDEDAADDEGHRGRE